MIKKNDPFDDTRHQAMTIQRHRVVRWTPTYGWETRTGSGEWEQLGVTRDAGAMLDVLEHYRRDGEVRAGNIYTCTFTINARLREDS